MELANRGAMTTTMRRPPGRAHRRHALWLAMLLASAAAAQTGPALPDAPDASLLTQAGGQKAGTGEIDGTVVDADAEIVPGAQLTLTLGGSAETRKATADETGIFRFTSLPPGKFTLTASYTGMKSGTVIGVLHPGDAAQTLTITLDAAAAESVRVVASREELAEAEIHVEEQQRILGIMPNFFTAYDWNAPPLTTRQKFELSWKNVIDPGSFFVTGVTAGIEQAENTFPGYRQGVAGYARRYGAATGDLVSGTFLGGAILPTLLHQDPRYFYKGTGTIKSRSWYAITRVWLCRGDNGKDEFNYSGILGDLAAGALSNAYYPPGSREGAALTFEEGALNLLGDAAGNLVQEFALKHLTPHSPKYASTTNSPTATSAPTQATTAAAKALGTIKP
jgi:hypothetical protein